jgi:dipeptide/tripeptide permease
MQLIMAASEQKTGLFSQFPKMFWVVNSLELFERGAYYGTMAVFSYHVYKNILPTHPNVGAVYGMLFAMLIFLLYFTPMISAALSEKYGYRKVLLAAFGILIIGYFLLSTVQEGQLGYLVLVLIFVGIGAGAFKPIISATIAHITRDDQRNVAYAIYYWMINLGATIMPLIIGFTLPTQDLYHYVFILSGVLIGVNIAISLFLFIDPVVAQKDLSVSDAVKRIGPALKDKKFVLLLAIYAGFWFMFAVSHTFLPWYMMDYRRMPEWFVVPFLATINPGTIIIAGPFLAKLIEKHKSLNVVMFGICVFCVGLTIVGFSNSSALFIIGIVIFSIGEFITHPGFIAHVSKIAPKKMVAIYMASIFLSTGSGNIVGGIVQGFWYDIFLRTLFIPKVYFALVVSVGLFTVICFIIYNRWMIREDLRKDPAKVVDTGIWTRPITMVIILLFIPVTIVTAYAAGPDTFYGTFEEDEDIIIDWEDYTLQTVDWQTDGYLSENSVHEDILNVSETNMISISFKLTWQDEADSDARHNNQPDEFSITVTAPDGQDQDSGIVTNGNTEFTINFEQPNEDPYFNGTGEYEIVINCLNAGDHEPLFPDPLGIRTESDNGNDWLLEVTYRYYESKA